MTTLITERALRDRRRSLIGWGIGLALYVALQSSIYPSVADSSFQRAIANYPEELKAFFGGAASFDFTTAAGYLNVELFSLVLPALLVIYAVGYGAATFAGEQQTGTLDLLLAYPVTRTRVALEKLLAMLVAVVLLALVVASTIEASGLVVGFDITFGNVLVACAGSALVALFIGGVAMLVGILTGSRAAATGAAASVFAAGYLIVGISGLVGWLEPARYVSPLHYANGTTPLLHGLPATDYLVLLVACALVAAATVVLFRTRDLVR